MLECIQVDCGVAAVFLFHPPKSRKYRRVERRKVVWAGVLGAGGRLGFFGREEREASSSRRRARYHTPAFLGVVFTAHGLSFRVPQTNASFHRVFLFSVYFYFPVNLPCSMQGRERLQRPCVVPSRENIGWLGVSEALARWQASELNEAAVSTGTFR